MGPNSKNWIEIIFSLFGQFYRIEENEIKSASASKNCENKFGSYGYSKLCESVDKQVNDKVIRAARSNDKRSHRFFLGIMDDKKFV